jgi:aspartokinase
MKTISFYVEESVKKSPYIVESLRDGLLNISAYARQIIPDIEKKYGSEVKLTSVVMAIQRMDFGSISHESKKLKSMFKKIKDILVRGHLNVYTIRQSDTLASNVAKLFQKMGNRNDVMCTYTQGVLECTVILSSSESKIFEKFFSDENVVEVEKKLSAFTILLPPENRVLSGVYYFILKQLAWAGINVIEVVSTSNEFTIVVEEKDSSLCFEVLRKIGS